jgi:hypothetical protein
VGTIRFGPRTDEIYFIATAIRACRPGETEPILSIERPKLLFRKTYVYSNLGFGEFEPHLWDISHDGKRFLMMKEAAATGKPAEVSCKINVVLNWFEELKQRIPIK